MAEVTVLAARSVADLGRKIADQIGAEAHGPIVLAPSSLRATDEGSATIEIALRQLAVPVEILVPRRGMSIVVSRLTGRTHSGWQSIHLTDHHYRLDQRLQSQGYIAVLSVTSSLRRGPFVLDLPMQFLHPADKLRVIADRRRRALIADVASLALPAMTVIVTAVGDSYLALITHDPIAAELCALAIAEQFFDPTLESQGPWEDSSVQRATELDMGIRIPADMRFVYTNRTHERDEVSGLLRRVSGRLGMTLPDHL
jgi:hypothetical protein